MPKFDPNSNMTPVDQRQLSMLNPRRPPAHCCVSLKHTPIETVVYPSEARKLKPNKEISYSKSDDHTNVGEAKNHSSPPSLQPLCDTSGESSNADEWFEQCNNEGREKIASFANNDSPFFIRNFSACSPIPEAQQQRVPQSLIGGTAQRPPLRADLFDLETDRSRTKDIRSIIDDLTVKNNKLKRRLRRYKKLHDSRNSFNNEKLFEIRIHSMGVEKKRELEEMLCNFVGSLSAQEAIESPGSSYEAIGPNVQYDKTAPPQATPYTNDSAYASMLTSGQGPTPSVWGSKHDHIIQPAQPRQQKIHPHHFTSESLPLPQTPEARIERPKRKLVVRRLEQLFAGNGAFPGPHQQALLSRKTSQKVTNANRSKVEGEREDTGASREAPIMSQESAYILDRSARGQHKARSVECFKHEAAEDIAEQAFATQRPDTSSEEQRSTKPFDLNSDRARAPTENLRYIRHLGFSPQDPCNAPQEGRGWVDLNLLVNMAQLHTLNVTIGFVRQALSELSHHLELSTDGRKARWKGSAVNQSKKRRSSCPSCQRRDGNNDRESLKKKLRTTEDNDPQISDHMSWHAKASTCLRHSEHETDRLMYKPLFYSYSPEDSDDRSSEETGETDLSPTHHVADRSTEGVKSDLCPELAMDKRSIDAGSIVFYTSACFYADLTGDPDAQKHGETPRYRLLSLEPLGQQRPYDDDRPMIFRDRGPPEKAKGLPEPMDLPSNPNPKPVELIFPPPSPPRSPGDVRVLRHIEMEVTGIGGIYPADHFAINVQSCYAPVEHTAAPTLPIRTATPRRFHDHLRNYGSQRKAYAAVGRHVVKLERVEYSPSELPSPLCLIDFDEEPTSEDSSDTDSISQWWLD